MKENTTTKTLSFKEKLDEKEHEVAKNFIVLGYQIRTFKPKVDVSSIEPNSEPIDPNDIYLANLQKFASKWSK